MPNPEINFYQPLPEETSVEALETPVNTEQSETLDSTEVVELTTETEPISTQPVEAKDPAEVELERVSEETARHKFERLETLHDFAFRFMNLKEYEELVTSQQLPRGEALLFKDMAKTALEFIETNQTEYSDNYHPDRGHGWKAFALEFTEWPASTLNIRAYDFMLTALSQARNEIPQGSVPNSERREKVIERFREILTTNDRVVKKQAEDKEEYDVTTRNIYHSSSWGAASAHDSLSVIDYVKEGGFDRSLHTTQANVDSLADALNQTGHSEFAEELRQVAEEAMERGDAKEFFSNWWLATVRPVINPENERRGPLEEESDRLGRSLTRIGAFGKSRMEQVKEFLDSNEPGKLNLRQVISAIGRAPIGGWGSTVGSEGDRQYQVAVFFDSRAESGSSDMIDVWTRLRSSEWEKRTREPLGNIFLGAVALLPDKELEQQLVEIANKAGEYAHPILTRHGALRFPHIEGRPDQQKEILNTKMTELVSKSAEWALPEALLETALLLKYDYPERLAQNAKDAMKKYHEYLEALGEEEDKYPEYNKLRYMSGVDKGDLDKDVAQHKLESLLKFLEDISNGVFPENWREVPEWSEQSYRKILEQTLDRSASSIQKVNPREHPGEERSQILLKACTSFSWSINRFPDFANKVTEGEKNQSSE